MKLSSKRFLLGTLAPLGLSAILAGCGSKGPEALPPGGAAPAAAAEQPPPNPAPDGATVGPGPEPAAAPSNP